MMHPLHVSVTQNTLEELHVSHLAWEYLSVLQTKIKDEARKMS